ncbi:MAG: retropepsin-like aspartic protease [Verrucomicrobiota bacterium]
MKMGKVIVQVKLTNHTDLVLKEINARKKSPRSMIADLLVDTGAMRLYLKSSVIRQLGLKPSGKVLSRTTNGARERKVYHPVRLEVQGRDGAFEVVEVDDDVPNLLGQIPLEHLDFVVDSKNRKLIPNPEHGDRQMSEEYQAL